MIDRSNCNINLNTLHVGHGRAESGNWYTSTSRYAHRVTLFRRIRKLVMSQLFFVLRWDCNQLTQPSSFALKLGSVLVRLLGDRSLCGVVPMFWSTCETSSSLLLYSSPNRSYAHGCSRASTSRPPSSFNFCSLCSDKCTARTTLCKSKPA